MELGTAVEIVLKMAEESHLDPLQYEGQNINLYTVALLQKEAISLVQEHHKGLIHEEEDSKPSTPVKNTCPICGGYLVYTGLGPRTCTNCRHKH